MTRAEAALLLASLTAEHGPSLLNDLCIAQFCADLDPEGDEPVEQLRDWCHDLAEQLESELGL